MTSLPRARDDAERRLALLYAVSRALAESDSADAAITRVLAAMGEALDWRVGTFWLLAGEDTLEPAMIWVSSSRDAAFASTTRALTLHDGIGLPGRVLRTRKPSWMRDVVSSGNFPRHDSAIASGLHSAFAFPVRAGQTLLGVVEFFSDEIEEPDPALLETAEGIGSQIGQFVVRRRATEAEEAERARNASMLQTALDSIITIDAEGRVLEWNPAAEAVFGRKRVDVIGKPMADLIIPPRLRDAHYAGLSRYLRTGEPHVLGQRIRVSAMRADGSEFPVELAITRVPTGGPPVFTAYLRDLSERQRLEGARALLLDASAVLLSTLDADEMLRALSSVIVPSFADWYAVDVVGEDQRIRRLEIMHRDPEKTRAARQLSEQHPESPAASRGVPAVIRTGRSELAESIRESLFSDSAQDEAHLSALRELGLCSYIIVPLRGRDAVLGAITFVTAESDRHYDRQDLSVAEELGRRAAQAMENARLFRATDEQRELLEQQATELEAQAEELEQTAAELEMSNEELKRTVEELEKRTTEAERARADAEEARHEADEANRAKSEFLASMSHELRTPLNAIIGYTELLDIGVHGGLAEEQRADLRRIARSAQHLLSLINDILNFAKVESGRLPYHLEAVQLDDVLAGVEDLVAPQVRAKQLHYGYTERCRGVHVSADREKLLQILVNLLSNAVRFTANGGRVDVSCEPLDDTVAVHVTDTGIGIPPDKLEAVFEPFVQVDREYAGQRQGTGLGLAISRELARAMGGDLGATSEPGKGSRFTLTLKRER